MTRINFEDLPSTNTPINAENLNKLNNVIVSSEEPTTGEEVWLEKGKNLFDTSLLLKGGWNGPASENRVVWGIKVKAGVTYTITNYSQKQVSIFETETLVQNITDNRVLFEHGTLTGTGNMTITTKNNAYLRLLFSGIDNVISISDVLPSDIQIEQGEVATSYEPYTPKKIHTKNDNGYEEFYNETENKTKTRVIWSGHLYNIGTEHTQLFSEPLETGKLYMFVLLGLSSSYRMTIPYIHGTGNGIQHSYYDGTTVVRWRINISTDGTGFYLDAASLQMGVSSGVLAVYKVD